MKPKPKGEFKVEDDVPLPTPGFSAAIRQLKKKGQSVLLPNSNVVSMRNLASVILGAGNYSVRKEGNGARVWRIK